MERRGEKSRVSSLQVERAECFAGAFWLLAICQKGRTHLDAQFFTRLCAAEQPIMAIGYLTFVLCVRWLRACRVRVPTER